MGQKINPIGLRLGINRTWDSRWFAGKNEYGKLLHEDVKIREILHKELKQAAVAKIVIERPHKKCRVTIHSARPGVVIGKKGADIDKLRKRVADITASDVVINIVEIRKHGMVSRRPCAAAHAARRHRLRCGHRVHDVRHLRRQGLDLQG
jgi:small subunit ribosomal protein S3